MDHFCASVCVCSWMLASGPAVEKAILHKWVLRSDLKGCCTFRQLELQKAKSVFFLSWPQYNSRSLIIYIYSGGVSWLY